MAEKVTFMKLKVDLECDECYKKVKKLLSKYPQIRDQKYDEKANIVAIMVVCCSPEKIRDKLCCKGGSSIKSIEIVEPPKPKAAEPEKKKEADKPKPAEPEKKKEAEKKKEGGEKPKPAKEPEKPKSAEPEKKKEADKPKDADKPKPKPKSDSNKPIEKLVSNPVPMIPQMPPPVAVPVGMCFAPPCCEGRPVVPYPNQYGGPVLCYDGDYSYGGGGPVICFDGDYSYRGGGPCYANRCDQHLSEENAAGCAIM